MKVSIGLAVRTLVRGIALFGLWMVFVDNVHQPEIVTGAVVAAAMALVGTLVAESRREPARVSLAMLRYAYRPFVLLITDTARVVAALALCLWNRRTASGRFRAVRYRAAGEDPESRARRILTEWSASLPANRYVIGIDPEARYALVHEMRPSPGPLDPLELG